MDQHRRVVDASHGIGPCAEAGAREVDGRTGGQQGAGLFTFHGNAAAAGRQRRHVALVCVQFLADHPDLLVVDADETAAFAFFNFAESCFNAKFALQGAFITSILGEREGGGLAETQAFDLKTGLTAQGGTLLKH